MPSERRLRCPVKGCPQVFPSPGTLRLHGRVDHGVAIYPQRPEHEPTGTEDGGRVYTLRRGRLNLRGEGRRAPTPRLDQIERRWK